MSYSFEDFGAWLLIIHVNQSNKSINQSNKYIYRSEAIENAPAVLYRQGCPRRNAFLLE